jgi:hypothetical protein
MTDNIKDLLFTVANNRSKEISASIGVYTTAIWNPEATWLSDGEVNLGRFEIVNVEGVVVE